MCDSTCAETWSTELTVNLSEDGCRATRQRLLAATPNPPPSLGQQTHLGHRAETITVNNKFLIKTPSRAAARQFGEHLTNYTSIKLGE